MPVRSQPLSKTLISGLHGRHGVENFVKKTIVFKTKIKHGKIEKYKARLVARGFTQQFGIDYNSTFAPVTRLETVRTALAIATNNKLAVHHIDVNTAFLHGDLDEEVYLELPEEITPDKRVRKRAGQVWKLRKSIPTVFTPLALQSSGLAA